MELENSEDKKERYRIELPEQKARDLLRISYNGSVEEMVGHLSVDKVKQLCFLRYSENADL